MNRRIRERVGVKDGGRRGFVREILFSTLEKIQWRGGLRARVDELNNLLNYSHNKNAKHCVWLGLQKRKRP